MNKLSNNEEEISADVELREQSQDTPKEKILFYSKQDKIIQRGEDYFHNEVKLNGVNNSSTVIHDANLLKRTLYSENILQREYHNFLLLTGAGTSVGIGYSDKDSEKVIGKTMSELWNGVSGIEKFDFPEFCKLCSHDIKNKDLEKLLSKSERVREFVEAGKVKLINEGIKKIQDYIRYHCNLKLPENHSPHQILINKLTKRKVKYSRTKIFTLNYDTLFEQAAQLENCAIIDGFSFSYPRRFNGRNFDFDIVLREGSRIKNEDNFAQKVVHLYKLHGSLGWKKDDGGIVQTGNTAQDQLMIFPKDTKYELSYEQPFFEMMSRFQMELRKNDILLLCIGTKLEDKHIFSVVKDALSQNHGLQLLIVNRSVRTDANWEWLIKKADEDSRITLVAEEFTDFTSHYPDTKTITVEEKLQEIYKDSSTMTV